MNPPILEGQYAPDTSVYCGETNGIHVWFCPGTGIPADLYPFLCSGQGLSNQMGAAFWMTGNPDGDWRELADIMGRDSPAHTNPAIIDLIETRLPAMRALLL